MSATTIALILSLFVEPGCVIDHATIDAIPPSTVRVVQVEQCGQVMCWRRYLLVDGTRRAESRACEAGHGQGDAITTTPRTGP